MPYHVLSTRETKSNSTFQGTDTSSFSWKLLEFVRLTNRVLKKDDITYAEALGSCAP